MNWHTNFRSFTVVVALLVGLGAFFASAGFSYAAAGVAAGTAKKPSATQKKPSASATASATPVLPQCNLSKATDELATLKNETADAPKTELKLRKDLLNATLICALADADALRASVGNLPAHDDAEKTLRTSFLAGIDAARSYYVEQASTTQALTTISDTRDLAREIQHWREANYTGLQWEANEFAALVKNDDLLSTADTRLSQIEQLVTPLTLLNSSAIALLLANAHTSLNMAHSEHDLAKGALRQNPPVPPENILSYSKLSLEALSKTYDTFFGINASIKKIIGQ